MKKLFVVSVLLGSFFGSTQAQDKVPDQAPRQQVEKPDPARLKKPPLKRRSVQQRIERMPAPAPVVTDGYRPTLHPRQPGAPILSGEPVPVLPPPTPPMPAQVNSCDAGGCTDTNGSRYTGGVGNTVLDQNGRSCTRTGTTVQCF